MDCWTRRAFLAAGLGLGACTRLERPPLRALYGPTRANTGQPPLVLIPGAFGSRLRDPRTGREIWPRSPASLLASDYRGLEVDIDPLAMPDDDLLRQAAKELGADLDDKALLEGEDDEESELLDDEDDEEEPLILPDEEAEGTEI